MCRMICIHEQDRSARMFPAYRLKVGVKMLLNSLLLAAVVAFAYAAEYSNLGGRTTLRYRILMVRILSPSGV